MASLTGDADLDKLLRGVSPGSADPIPDKTIIDQLMQLFRNAFRPDAPKADPGAASVIPTPAVTPTATPTATPEPEARGPLGGQQGSQFAASPAPLDQSDQLAIQQLLANSQRQRTGFSV